MKRFLCLISVLILIFCTGCKNKEDGISIKFASWGSQSEIAILKPIIENYEKQNPNIKIEFLHIPQNYFQKIHLLFASNLAPDIIFINNLNIPVYANYLEDLTNYVEKDVFYEKTLQSLSFDGKLLAIPRDVSAMVIYFNVSLFDKYGIEYPSKTWTFDDLLKTCLKFKSKGIFGISFDENSLYYLPYLMSSGGGILSDDLKTEIINTPQSKEGLQFYSDLRNKYNVAPTKSQSASTTMAQMFLQQKLAMHLSGRWMVPKYRTSTDFDWDVINFPTGKVGSIVPLDASGWALCKNSKNKLEAIKFIQYLSSKENISKMTESGLITPARVDISESDVFLGGMPAHSEVFLETIKTAKPTPVSKNYTELNDKLEKQLEPTFNNI